MESKKQIKSTIYLLGKTLVKASSFNSRRRKNVRSGLKCDTINAAKVIRGIVTVAVNSKLVLSCNRCCMFLSSLGLFGNDDVLSSSDSSNSSSSSLESSDSSLLLVEGETVGKVLCQVLESTSDNDVVEMIEQLNDVRNFVFCFLRFFYFPDIFCFFFIFHFFVFADEKVP